MAAIPSFGEAHLQRVCDILADTRTGLTGSEIGRLLGQLGIEDPQPSDTKRHRLFAALKARQAQDRCGNNVAAFVQAAMEPVRFTNDTAAFEERRAELSQVLAFCGYSLGEDGKLRAVAPVSTLSAAEERAGRIRAELRRAS